MVDAVIHDESYPCKAFLDNLDRRFKQRVDGGMTIEGFERTVMGVRADGHVAGLRRRHGFPTRPAARTARPWTSRLLAWPRSPGPSASSAESGVGKECFGTCKSG